MALITELFKTGVLYLLDLLCIAILVRALIEAFTSGESESGAYRFCCVITEPFVAFSAKLLSKANIGFDSIGIDLSKFLACFFLLLLADLLRILVP